MKKMFNLMLILGSILTICNSANAMDFTLGQYLAITNSSNMIGASTIPEGAFLVLKGVEFVGDDDSKVLLKLKMFFTEGDMLDSKVLVFEDVTYQVIVNKADSIQDIEGILLFDKKLWPPIQ